MSPIGVIARRTVSRAFYRMATAIAIIVFTGASSAIFALLMMRSEGLPVTLAALWGQSVAWVLPFIAAYFAMDEFASERLSGRQELLFSTPIRERDIVLGKYIGVLVQVALTVAISFALALAAVRLYAPVALSQNQIVDFVPVVVGLALQGTLWSAVTLAFSTFFRNGAVAGFASLLATVALPRGGWVAMMEFSSSGAVAFGEMPFDAQIADMSAGVFSTASGLSYILMTIFFLFLASKHLLLMRIGGCGGHALRVSTVVAMILSAVATTLAITLAHRLDARIEVQLSAAKVEFSSRTRSVLSDTQGEVAVSVFLARKDPRFRSVCRFLRSLASESAALGGARFRMTYVDPRWDVGPAERLVRDGAVEGSVIFTRGHRTVRVTLADGFSERAFASALHRLTNNPQRRVVCWTTGHGEYDFTDYGPWGMSDIARELMHDGYINRKLDLASLGDTIGADCAMIVVAGAKRDFSRAEIERIDDYLRKGGRLLLLQNTGDQTALASLLPSWGLRATAFTMSRVKTLSGSDVIVDEFASHQVTGAMSGSRIIMERPLAYVSSTAVDSGAGADKIEYTALASVDGAAVVAAVERGAGLGKDLSLRPTRIVCIGDGTFAVNGFLAARANANRDFFLRCVAYLSGTEAAGGDGHEAGLFVTELDRQRARRMMRALGLWMPATVGLVIGLVIFIRRRDG